VQVYIPAGQIVEACQALKQEFGFEMLEFVTGMDYWPQENPRFNVLYNLYSFQHNQSIMLRVELDGNAPHVPTVEKVYANANWYEREVWDMFGVRFDGHSDPRRILMPADWEGHPLRKDYPLGYEEVQFTFNVDEVNETKRYAGRDSLDQIKVVRKK
jgi:NADH-quinone oxidoreductase subunit C